MTKIKGGVKKEVVQGLASGKSQPALSKRAGVSQQTISQFANKSKLKV